MNKTLTEALAFADALVADDPYVSSRIQRFVIPPFTSLREVKIRLAASSVKVGAQNMHWEDNGAWTGEVSPPMLTDCGADLVELGHSERREHFSESDTSVGLKVAAAVRHRLTPLICVGETLAERESGHTKTRLIAQVEGALEALADEDHSAPVMFAYEPVWAIGNRGTPATPEYADKQQQLIKHTAAAKLGAAVPCLYGGSVNGQNCRQLIQCQHVDGLFIGRSALDVQGNITILNACAASL